MPVVAYQMVEPLRSTSAMLRRADSIAFWIATGTSLALPRPKPHAPGAIADHGERRKTEDAAALDHLGYAIDLDEFLNQSFFFDFFRISHDALELQTGFTRRICQRFDTTVVAVPGTIEGNF